jgi:myo-inositol-1-phosphate synthase
VYRGPTLDGVIEEMKDSFVHESKSSIVDVAKILKKNKAEIVINLVPSGSDEATYFYAREALKAGCCFINCIPTPLATLPNWVKKFEEKGLIVLGDDIKSQLGATMLNRFLLHLLQMRGIKVTKSHQDNRGGNADHFNLLYRAKHKEESKSKALKSFLGDSGVKPAVRFEYIGKPSGHKLVNLIIEGEMFGRIPISISSVIEDEISINGAGTLVDAIRVIPFLIDKKKQKEAVNVCPFLMKNSIKAMSDSQAFEVFNRLVNSHEEDTY